MICNRMQKSPNRHVLVGIRQELGMTQGEFGKLVGLARSTVQAIELGRLPLSEQAAHRISEETDVNPFWLLENRLGTSAITRHGQPWNIKWFRIAQAGVFRGAHWFQLQPQMELFKVLYELQLIMAGRELVELIQSGFLWKLRQTVDSLWETLPANDRDRIYKKYDESNPSDEEILKHTLAEAHKLLAVNDDLKQRTGSKKITRSPSSGKRTRTQPRLQAQSEGFPSPP
jgi:transcriptional regulator with XRE-family HTH domain